MYLRGLPKERKNLCRAFNVVQGSLFKVTAAQTRERVSYRHGAEKVSKAGPTWAQVREGFTL